MYAVRINTRCSVRDTDVLYGRCIFEVNREAGVNPARSRHCEWSVALMMPLSNSLVCACMYRYGWEGELQRILLSQETCLKMDELYPSRRGSRHWRNASGNMAAQLLASCF